MYRLYKGLLLFGLMLAGALIAVQILSSTLDSRVQNRSPATEIATPPKSDR